MKNNQKGRSMIEMLGVLAIIGVLSVGGIAGYSKAMAKFRANKTIDQISHIVANVRILFGSQKNYTDLGDGTGASATAPKGNAYLLANANILPDEMRQNTGEVKADATMDKTFINPYSGFVSVYRGDRSATGDNRAFIIEYYGIPKDACIDLASQDWNSSSGSGLLAFAVNTGADALKTALLGNCTTTTDTTNAAQMICSQDMPMKVAGAMTACSSANNNALIFKFY